MYEIVSPLGSKAVIHRISDGAFIPMDENNLGYIHYLKWLEKGNTSYIVSAPQWRNINAISEG